ncbi:MAG: ribonuclease P protein component [Pigmentiphaga sp.]|nr:ribonuclease P protein component [Pigmentiphaga sp.]MDX3906153.1 ribonuclease P protein component [Pigmentiphaga sp.]
MRASYPGTARLRSPAEFAPALKGRRLAKGALFVLSMAPSSQPRLGLVVGKRFAPLAASRNAIKRVAREAFRLRRTELPAGDYVLRLHARIPSCSLTALKRQARQEIDGHLARAAKASRPALPGGRP